MYKLYEVTILRQWITDTTRLDRREIHRSTFTLAFCLKALSKLEHKKVEPKKTITVSLGAGNQDWSLQLLRWWEFEGQRPEMRKLHKGALEIC